MGILLGILGVIVLLVIAFLAIARIAPKQFRGSLSATFSKSPEEVYALLSDIEGLPNRRKEIDKVELLLPSERGLKRWREIAAMGGFAEFETLRDIRGRLIEVHLYRSSFGITGNWTYEIEPWEKGSRLTITEVSRADKMVTRGLLTLAGRNATLRQEVRNLRKLLN
jgi:hypothetical protein